MVTTATADFNRAFERHANKFSDIAENVVSIMDGFEGVAEQFEKAHSDAKVQKLKEAALNILRLQKTCEDTAAVLRRLQTTHSLKVDTVTDFPALMAQGLAEREAAGSFDPAKTDLYRELQDAIASVHGTAADATQEAGEDEDDDVVLDATQGDNLAPNNKCPLSGRQLMDIEEPVMDSKGFVYEKTNIQVHIRNTRTVGDYVQCPVFGTNHKVALKDLKPARRVIKAKRRHKANPNAAKGGHHSATQLDMVEL